MYLLLGNSHMERRDYDCVVQSFEHARPQSQHLTNQLFLVVSLVSFLTAVLQHVEISHPLYYQISGWKFDHLGTTI